MAARTIAVAQQKGGAGKTTIAIQLAVAWSVRGLAVSVLDVDPQGSASAWFKTRREPAGLTVQEVPGWRLAGEIDRLRASRDLLVVDTPPHAETDSRVSVRSADLILVPVQPSPMDLWATRATLELARREKTPALLILNRLPPRGRLNDMLARVIADEQLPVARSRLGNRSAFAASLLEGKGVAETGPHSTAGQEIAALADEIFALLAAAPG